jgi:transposase-like protein
VAVSHHDATPSPTITLRTPRPKTWPPTEVNTDRAATYPRVLDELLLTACHIVEQYANNPIEADHSRLKARLRPMRGLKRLRSARVVSAGHALVRNLRRGHDELVVDVGPRNRLAAVFTELALAV